MKTILASAGPLLAAAFLSANACKGEGAARRFDIADYGARATDCLATREIQSAIDACHAAGGGEVVVPEGTFRTGGLELKSGVTLRLLNGATLEGSRNPADYAYAGEEAWYRGLIRAEGACNIGIVGERYSTINGMNCYDPTGEERFRGPHAIRLRGCTNVFLSGYSVRDSANWAHALFACADVSIRNVRVFGGHDGIDLHCCENAVVEGCEIRTGDDAIAGFGNYRCTVRDCILDTSCNFFRFGGTDCLFERCHGVAPSSYGHRWGLPDEEKRLSLNHGEGLRRGASNAFVYYCDSRWNLTRRPGGIVVRDCRFDQVGSVFSMQYDGRNQWCWNRPLASIAFENCTFGGVVRPIRIYGGASDPLDFAMRGCRISAQEGKGGEDVATAYCFRRIAFRDVALDGFRSPRIVRRSEGAVEVSGGTAVETVYAPDPRDRVFTFGELAERLAELPADDAAFARWLDGNAGRDDQWGAVARMWRGGTPQMRKGMGSRFRRMFSYYFRDGAMRPGLKQPGSDVPVGLAAYAIAADDEYVARVLLTDFIRRADRSPAAVAGVRAALARLR